MSVEKYVITGHILEVYQYEKYVCGRGGKKKEKNKKEDSENLNDEIKEIILKNYTNHNVVRSNMIRRLACANFSSKSSFITLTFDDKKVAHDIHNVKECNYEFKKFIMRLKEFLKKNEFYKNNLNIEELKYLAVIEFQDKNDRRAVHYLHVLLKLYIQIPFSKYFLNHLLL